MQDSEELQCPYREPLDEPLCGESFSVELGDSSIGRLVACPHCKRDARITRVTLPSIDAVRKGDEVWELVRT